MNILIHDHENIAVIIYNRASKTDFGKVISFCEQGPDMQKITGLTLLRDGYLIMDYRNCEDRDKLNKLLASMKSSFYDHAEKKYVDFDDFALDHLHDKFFQEL
ncbi:MAG: hypothetical protein WAV84_15470 [Bacteroidota bacterium]